MTGNNAARQHENGDRRPLRRTAARIAAVQALYQMEMTGVPADEVARQFLAGERPRPAFEDEEEAWNLPDPDPDLFRSVVEGVTVGRARLHGMIGEALTQDWTVPRLEILLRLILEAGAFEITARSDIPANVSINEYVNVSKAFFHGPEPALVNAVLDAIAKFHGGVGGAGGTR